MKSTAEAIATQTIR